MATLELVDRLRQYANVSYADASEALDASEDDLLEAIIYLERQGKIAPKVENSAPPQHAHYSTQSGTAKQEQAFHAPPPKEETFGDLLHRFFKWLGTLFQKSAVNLFCVSRHNKEMFTIPIIILVLCLVFSAGLVFVLMIVGLFFGYSYNFSGPDINKKTEDTVNQVMSTATNAAEEIKSSINHSSNQAHAAKKQDHQNPQDPQDNTKED